MAGPQLGLVGGAWLVTGGCTTVLVILRTLPRDLSGIWKLFRLVSHAKQAEWSNLTVPEMFFRTVLRCPNKVWTTE